MSHFRSSTLAVTQNSLTSFDFGGQTSFRASYFGDPQPGQIVTNGDVLDFGDGSGATIYLKVLSVINDVMTAAIVDSDGSTIVHEYAGGRMDYEAFFQSGARTVTNDQFSQANYRSEATVNVGIINHAPISTVPAVVQVADNTLFQYQLSASDADGNPLTYSLGIANDFIYDGAGTDVVAPSGVTLSSAGLLTWDVRDMGGSNVAPGEQYIVTVKVSDGLTATGLDFLLRVVDTSDNQAPVFDSVPRGDQTIARGGTSNLAIHATDPNMNLQSITVLNPPTGLTTEYHADEGELHIDFSPTVAGTYVVNFQATDTVGLTTQTSITYVVSAINNPPTLSGSAIASYTDTSTTDLTFQVAEGRIDNTPGIGSTGAGDLVDDAQGNYSYALTGAGVSAIAGGTIISGQYGQLIVSTDGRYQFTPNAAAIDALPAGPQTASYTIQVTDNDGSATPPSASGNFTVNLTGAADPVQLTGGLLATFNDTGAMDVFAVQTGRIDNDSTATSSGVGQLTGDTGSTYTYAVTGAGVSNSIVNGQAVGTEIVGTYGRLVLATDGRYQYVPNNAAINTLPAGMSQTDTFTVQVTDSNGSVASNPFTVQVNGATEAQVTLTGGNIATYVDGTGVDQFGLTEGKFDTDVTGANTASTNSNGQQVGSLDGGTGAVSFALTGANVSTLTAGGQVVGTVVENEYGRFTVSNDGRYQFVPNQDAINALPEGVDPTVSYTVQATDSVGSTSTATYTVNLEGAFDPVQLDGGSLGSYDDTAALDVFGVIQGRIDSDATRGTNGVGQLINDADKQLIYAVFDQGQGRDTTTLTGDDGEYIGVIIRSEYGSLTLAADGRYEFVPNQAGINALAAGELTQLQFNVAVISAHDVSGLLNGTGFPDDGTLSLDGAPFTIDLTGARDTAPVLAGGTLATFDDTGGQNSFGVVQGRFDTDVTGANNSGSNQTENFVGVLEGGTGPVHYALTGAGVTNVTADGTIVGYQATSAYGQLTVATDGRYQFVPNEAAINSLPEGSNPMADFSVQVTDANGATSTAAFSVNLLGGDDAPTVGGTSTQLTETNAPLSITGQFEASGLPGDTLTYTHPSNGSGIGKGDATEYFTIYDQKLDSQTTLTDTQAAALGATFTLNAQTGGYSFNIASPDFLDPGQTLRVSYEVEVTNQRGETSGEYVNINVLGTAEQGPAGTAGDDTLNGGAFGDIINGGSGDDIINGNGGNDILRGQSGDDVISGGAGHNTIDGGSGLDTGVLDSNYDDYFIYRTGNNTVTIERADHNGPVEVSQFSNVESFQFADQTVAFQDLLSNSPQPVPGGADLSHTGLIIG